MSCFRDDRGQSAIELMAVLPCVVAVVLVIVTAARLIGARTAAEAVARDAAVAAAQSAPQSAADVVNQVGDQAATNSGMDPSRLQLSMSGSLARGGTITVVARYTVSLAPMPGSFTIQVSRAEPVDAFRSFG